MTDTERYISVEALLLRWEVDARTLDKIIDCGGLGYFAPAGVRIRRFPLSLVMDYERQHFRQSTSA